MSDLSKFIGMRNTDKITDVGLTVIDESRKEEIFIEPRSDCSFEIIESRWGRQKNPLIIKVMGVNADGSSLKGICAGRYTVNWGDGHTSTYLKGIEYWMQHYYDVPPGQCNDYFVTVTFDPFLCECWDQGPITIKRKFTVCNSVSCSVEEGEADWIAGKDIYSGGYRMAVYYMGYDLDDYWWHDARVYGRIKHYLKLGGSFQRYSPNYYLDITLHGNWFVDNCDGAKDHVSKHRRKWTSNLRNRYKRDGNDMVLRDDDQLFCDFKVYHTNSAVPDVELLNVPFWE